jgi:release factor glutamine methyltransferase
MAALELEPAPDLAPGITIAAARRALARAFRAAGLDSPELDARLLVGHAAALDHRGLAVHGNEELADEAVVRLAGLTARRLAHEPVARILGVKEFWGLPLVITPDVLVPRPDTETVVEAALAALGPEGRREPLRIADLGTGSGAILLALLSELPAATGVGTDRSFAALLTARANSARLGLSSRASFLSCDFGAALGDSFDLVVSNPPYVVSAELTCLPAEVRNYDPLLALDGGADGLAAYRAVARDAARILGRNGHLIVELGAGLATAVQTVVAAEGLPVTAPPRPDLAGIPRAITARRLP